MNRMVTLTDDEVRWIADVLSDDLSQNSQDYEFGDYIPLTDLKKKTLEFKKRGYENKKAEIRGEEPKPIVRDTGDVEAALKAGLIETGITPEQMRKLADASEEEQAAIFEKAKPVIQASIHDQFKKGIISEDAAVGFLKKHKFFEEPKKTPKAKQKESQVEQAKEEKPKQNYTTKDVTESLSGNEGKKTGWDVLFRDSTDEEKEKMKRERQDRINKSFLRKPPI